MNNHAVEVLMVEDSEGDAELAIRALSKRGLANHLIWVKDGAEALDFLFTRGAYAGRAGAEAPKVILLDLKMPRVNGLEVLRQIKSDERTKGIPVAVLTSSTEEVDLDECYKLGVNSYVSKPVEFDEFAKVVSKLGMYWLLINKLPGS